MKYMTAVQLEGHCGRIIAPNKLYPVVTEGIRDGRVEVEVVFNDQGSTLFVNLPFDVYEHLWCR